MAVPQNDSEFNSFMSTSNTYLNASTGGVQNFVRLGLTTPERNQWDTYTTSVWPPVWAKVIDPGQKTKAIVNQKELLKKTISAFMNPLLYRMASMPGVNSLDIVTLLLPDLTRERVPRPAIETAPNTNMTAKEGAKILFSNRVDSDSSRDSMHPDANALQVVYKIGNGAPANPAACPGNFMSSKARFMFDGGMENDGKKLYCYTRWVNIADQSKNGPWSAINMATISAGTPEVVEEV